MKEIIEIKRKEFEIIEKLGDRSYKVERKGKYYFLKDFGDDIKGFQKIIKNQEVLRNCGFTMPKVYMWDKNANIFVVDYIDGENVFNILCKEDLDEKILEGVFLMAWYARKARYYIDFDPINFRFSDGTLFYLPYKKATIIRPYWSFIKKNGDNFLSTSSSTFIYLSGLVLNKK